MQSGKIISGSQHISTLEGRQRLYEAAKAKQPERWSRTTRDWTSKRMAEVDFIIVREDQVLPLEVKAGVSRQKKSLRVYGEKYRPPILSRATLMNFKEDGDIRNYPLYALWLFLKNT